ncbi:MAG: heparinase II/III domain-containing protein [Planctomycetota bacterium]|jgi:hypothetical protein
METVKLKNHHLALTIRPEGGRILEVRSLSSGDQLVSWWPFKISDPANAGGIGEASVPAGAAPFKWEKTANSLVLTRSLPGGLTFEKTITLPADSLVFSLSITVRNTSPTPGRIALHESAAVCPGFGGACPRPESGVSHCRERAFVKRPGTRIETVNYEVFESVRVERDGLEWAAFGDPVSNNLFSVTLPDGHTTITTRYHWWLEWSNSITIEPSGVYSADFHFAATSAVDLPLIVSEHIVTGFKRAGTPLEEEGAGKVIVYGLDEAAAGNEISVKADGRELLGGKPLPAGRESVDVPLPNWHSSDGLALEVSVAGKFAEAHLPASRCSQALGQLAELSSQARRSAESGKISRPKAACISALARMVDSNADKDTDFLEAQLEKSLDGASSMLDCPLESPTFYGEDERARLERLARRIDMKKETASLAKRLGRTFDGEIPRFREDDGDTFACATALLECALLLTVHPDENLLALFKERLGDFTAMWRKFGQIRYETIHHGVLLCRLIPACKLALENGWLTPDEETDALAMIIDLCRKIHRQGGRQFRLSNWWAMESAALAYAGALFPFLPEAADWRARARQTFYWLLVHGTLADGGFWEMSPSYHLLTLTYLHHIAEAFLRWGTDLYRDGLCGGHIGDMVGFLKAVMAPAGAIPAFDDSGRSAAPETLLSLAKRLCDGELAFQAQKAFGRAGREAGAWNLFVPLETPDVVEFRRPSQVLVPSGKLILRSHCHSITLIFDFGAHGGWHGHSDKLSFEAFWRDLCVLPDAGSYRYEEALHWEWFKTAPAHNTITLGDLDRTQTCGRLLYFEEGRGFITAGMSAPVSERVQHRREVTLSDRALLIDDFIENAPEGETIVSRFNSFVPFEISGNAASFKREDLAVTITAVSPGLDIEQAQVPLMPQTPSPKGDYVKGSQLRISRKASGGSDRVLVRIDFTW